MKTSYDFLAFISYKREDEKWAKWLQGKIEGYRLPANLTKKYDLPAKLPRVFRDTTDIEPGLLSDNLKKSLDNSQFLIVICSVKSANSFWVGEEIKHFIQTGRQDQILLFIVDGNPYSGDPQTECIHPIIRNNLPEMLGVNINEESSEWKYIKYRKAYIRLLSRMLGITFDTLWNRFRRKMIVKMGFNIAVLICFLLGTGYVYYVNQPFAMELALERQSGPGSQLTFPKTGVVATLYLDNQTIRDTFHITTQKLMFPNIMVRNKLKKVRLTIEATGFHPIDTLIIPQKKTIIALQRNEAWYGIVKGIIRRKIDDNTVEGVEVEIKGHTALTDKDGYFSVIVPLIDQSEVYSAKIRFKTFVWDFENVYPMQNNELLINTIYIP